MQQFWKDNDKSSIQVEEQIDSMTASVDVDVDIENR